MQPGEEDMRQWKSATAGHKELVEGSQLRGQCQPNSSPLELQVHHARQAMALLRG